MHAGLALDGLEHDSTDGVALRLEQRLKRRDVVLRRGREPVGQRLEKLLLGRLCGRGERGERATMEALLHRNDHARGHLPVAAFRLDTAARIGAGELDGALVRLGARVREERLPRRLVSGGHFFVQRIGEQLAHLPAMLDVVVVAHVDERGCLLGDRAHDGGVAMSQAHRADSRDEVEVLLAGIVANDHAFAFHQLDRLTAERAHDVGFLQLLLFSKTHCFSFSQKAAKRPPTLHQFAREAALARGVERRVPVGRDDHGADALVGEHLEQKRMRRGAV